MHLRVCVVAALLAAANAEDLVAAIKNDLQKNNDDYMDLRRARALTNPPSSSPPPSIPPTSSPSLATVPPPTPEPAPKFLIPVEEKPKLDTPLSGTFRRASKQKDTDNGTLEVVKVASWYPSLTTQRPKLKPIEPKIAANSANRNAIEPIVKTKSAVVKTQAILPKRPVGTRARLDPRLNELAPHERYHIGKGLVKSSSSIDSEYYKELDDLLQRSRMKGRVAKGGGAAGGGPIMRASWKKRERIRLKHRQQAKGRGRGAGHKRVRGAVPNAEPPAAEVLDMAPARGARVYSKRLRHRLCSRSVLNPEGPKYNSAGQLYLHQFTPRGDGHFGFNQTRAPRLLLPRCCNCCKKSVLGCE